MAAFLSPLSITAQEAAQFGAWRAYCAPVAGCVLGAKSGGGDTIAFVEPPSGDAQALLFLVRPIKPDTRIVLSIDDVWSSTLDPEAGWRMVQMASGMAVVIDSVLARDDLTQQMRRYARLTVSYILEDGRERSLAFSLNGFSDTRAYVDEE